MTVIQKPRRSRGLKSMRAAVVASAAVVGLVLGNGTASAAVDNANSVVDGTGNTITVSQSDTFINSVPPLDNNPLSREIFHNGRASFDVVGPEADDFSGTLSIGYQIGFPAAIAPTITFSYSTPQLEVGDGNAFTVSDILPQLGVSIPISSGGGIAEVEAASGSVEGASGSVQLSNFHGFVTGVLGNVTVRPYVKLVSDKGDTVVTYGSPWRLN
ncbi:porin MspA [Rhodococcoides trifolii]|uniref:Porin MspA n=1 Tax=Rhodococcoides trifolii TaxID=908250 RepID=A0A917G114_9NOCA|nr:MspA family porin [Rhodococcus trifolii]GGG17277.1 porin MspA [Rhodococcus trifolii]